MLSFFPLSVYQGGNKSKPSVLSTAIRSSASSNTILNGEVSAPSRHPLVSSTSTPPKLRKASLWETLRRPLTSPKSASEIEDKGTDVFLILETDELLIVRQELHLADMGVTPPSRRDYLMSLVTVLTQPPMRLYCVLCPRNRAA